MPRESLKNKKTRALRVLRGLQALYPDAATELMFTNPFELLIATILSAQATDVSVNAATPALFAAYPSPARMAAADVTNLESLIRTIGLYRNKAKNIKATAAALETQFGGEVPNDFIAIQTLPGVGRKTANVVLSNAFGRPGIAVDTHVGRLARRLGFSAHSDPDKVESDLENLFPRNEWIFLHHALILHGRRVCSARAPNCAACELLEVCPQIGV
jgi:endonuclease III